MTDEVKNKIAKVYELVKRVDVSNRKEVENLRLFQDIEGGTLKGQVTTGLYLE